MQNQLTSTTDISASYQNLQMAGVKRRPSIALHGAYPTCASGEFRFANPLYGLGQALHRDGNTRDVVGAETWL